MDPRYHRPPSPGSRRLHNPMRSSTGTMGYDPYPAYYDPYYATPRSSGLVPPPRSSASRVEEIGPPQIVRSREPPVPTQNAGDYIVRPRRSTMESGIDRSRRPASLMPPVEYDRARPVVHGGRGIERPSSPLAQSMTPDYGGNYYIQPHSSHSPRPHARYPSMDHDSRYLREGGRNSRERAGYPRSDPRSGAALVPHIRSPDYDESYGYSYTDPREQFYRDVAARPRVRPRRGSIDAPQQRPLSMTELGDYLPRVPRDREAGPPPSTRGWDKIDRTASLNRGPRASADVISEREYAAARSQGALDQLPHRTSRRPISVHQGYDDGYSSYREDYDEPRQTRHRPKPSYDSDAERGTYGHSGGVDRYGPRDEAVAYDPIKAKDVSDAEAPRKEHRRHHHKSDRDKYESETDRHEHKHRHRTERNSESHKHRDKEGRSYESEADEPLREHRSRKHRDRSSDDREIRTKDVDIPRSVPIDTRVADDDPVGRSDARRKGPREVSSTREAEEEEEMRERERRRKERRERGDWDGRGSDDIKEPPIIDLAGRAPQERELRDRRYRERSPSEDRYRMPYNDREPHERASQDRVFRDGEQMYAEPEDLHDDYHRERTRDPDRGTSIDIVPPPKSPKPVKGILRPPTEKFPEDPAPVREGVAPHKDSLKNKKGIPPGARWTKIDRKLVNPAALEEGNERFEERLDYVIVLRVLTKEEIQEYARRTQAIRDARYESERRSNPHRTSRQRAIEPAASSRDPDLPSAVEARALEASTPPHRAETMPPLSVAAQGQGPTPPPAAPSAASLQVPLSLQAPEMERVGSKDRERRHREREREKENRGSKDGGTQE